MSYNWEGFSACFSSLFLSTNVARYEPRHQKSIFRVLSAQRDGALSWARYVSYVKKMASFYAKATLDDKPDELQPLFIQQDS